MTPDDDLAWDGVAVGVAPLPGAGGWRPLPLKRREDVSLDFAAFPARSLRTGVEFLYLSHAGDPASHHFFTGRFSSGDPPSSPGRETTAGVVRPLPYAKKLTCGWTIPGEPQPFEENV